MAETPRAGTGDFACRSWRYWCSTMLNRLDNLSIVGTVLISSLPPPDNRVTQPTHAQYSLFSRLFPSFSNWWVHLDTVSRQIFGDIQETQCSQKWTAQIFCMRRAAPWCRCICEICACICDCCNTVAFAIADVVSIAIADWFFDWQEFQKVFLLML